MRLRAPAWLAVTLLAACTSAEIRSDAGSVPDARPGLDARAEPDATPEDLGVAGDAGPADLGRPDDAGPDLGSAGDAGAMPDARPPDLGVDEDAGPPADAGPSDAGDPRVVFADDLTTSPFEGTPPRWTITNFDATSWQWAASERLQSGPGPSCVYWGNRLAEPDPPFCDEGPALLHSPAWDVGSGRFTLELDVRAQSADPGHRSFMVFLLRAREDAPGWDFDPTTGDVVWDGLDHMLETRMVLGTQAGMGPHLSVCPATGAGACETRLVPALLTRVWYSWHVEVCGGEVRSRVYDRETGALLHASVDLVDVTPPAGYEQVQLVLGAEAPGKDFDNVRVTRGCEGDPP